MLYIYIESYSLILWNIMTLHVYIYIYIRYIHINLLYQEQLQKLREETARDFTGFDHELMASYGFGISHIRIINCITRNLNLK
jgi:tryptophan 2,3-dioxygenase